MANYRLLQETGDFLLQENGDKILLDGYTYTEVTKSLQYVCQSTVAYEVEKSLKYTVKVTQTAVEKSLTYTVIQAPAAITKSLKYTVLTTHSAANVTLSPGTMVNNTTVGSVSWTNPDNAKVSDDVYATAILATTSRVTHYLKATNFGFSIPIGATITGILVEIERKNSSATSLLRDKNLRIVKADGTIGTTNKADTTTSYPTTNTYASYGSSSDLWGEDWDYTKINDVDFGVVLSAENYGASENTVAVDHIRITVYYILPISKELTYKVKITPAAIEKSLKYTILASPGAVEKSLTYTVTIIPGAITKSLTYDVFTSTKIDKSLTYKVVAPITNVEKSLKYTVTSTKSAVEKSLKYCVVTIPNLAYHFHLLQENGDNILLEDGGRIILDGIGNNIKTLKYTVLTANPVTKSLKYTILTLPTAITKSLQYIIAIPRNIGLRLDYRIILNNEETELYHKHNQVFSGKYTTKGTVYANQYAAKGTAYTTQYTTKGTVYTNQYPAKGTTYTYLYHPEETHGIVKSLTYTIG